MTEKETVDLFIKQVKKACSEHGTPLPNIVKNHQPGDDRLYRTRIGDKEYDLEKEYYKLMDETQKANDEFDLINNNTDER